MNTSHELYLSKEKPPEGRPERNTIAFWENDKSYRFLVSKKKFLVNPVVDLGCGPGPLTILASRLGFSITGFDCMQTNTANAMHIKSDTDSVQFATAFLDSIPAKTHSFKSAILKEVLEHIIAPEIPKILEEIKRILEPGSPVLITVPRESILNPCDPKQHVTFFHSPKELALFLKKHGFSIIQKEYNLIYRRICIIARTPL